MTKPELDSKNSTASSYSDLGRKKGEINNASGKWVTAYLASYKHYTPEGNTKGNLPTEEIDWDAFTHLSYFALLANADGSVNDVKPYNNLNPSGVRAITEAGHDAGVPVLISVGGWGNYSSFSSAIEPGSRDKFISNIMRVFSEWGFDGIDVNMEPIKSSDKENYIAFVSKLYNRLQNKSTPLLSKPLMTAAVHWQPELIAQVQDKFDQINIMTYNLSGAWTGWVTWHNAPVYDSGYKFPGYNHTVPSADDDLDEYSSAGISVEKLGIGIDFYGYVWTGVSKPKEQWEDGNAPDVEAEVPYHSIMNQHYQSRYYKWDSVAEAAYLSIEDQSQKQFITYDNERSIRSKYDFVNENNLGGTIIWDIAAGYRKNKPAGERDKLLQEVKKTFMEGEQPAGDTTPPSVSLTSPSDGASVSGIVTISAEASDNDDVKQVQFTLNGSAIADPVTSTPYSIDWNSSNVADGSHTIGVQAIDAAGNQQTASLSVIVSNSGETKADGIVYSDKLKGSWINSSWSSTTDFSNSEEIFNGSNSIKINQRRWGALAMRNGNWNSTEDFNTGKYQTVEFAVYTSNDGMDLNVSFQNDDGASFPKVNYGSVSSGNWQTIEIPVKKMNPDDKVVHRLVIADISGNERTYYVDNVLLK